MNCIVISPLDFGLGLPEPLRPPDPSLHLYVERGAVKSTSPEIILFITQCIRPSRARGACHAAMDRSAETSERYGVLAI
jgi:hypothetical protein